MIIRLICPAPPGTLHGNRVTAIRWAQLLRRLGHRAIISQQWKGERCDALIALHARRSADSAVAFATEYPDHPLIVALTGTDVYHDIHHDERARQVLDIATRLTVLQPLAIKQLPARHHKRTRVIYQSVQRTPMVPQKPAQGRRGPPYNQGTRQFQKRQAPLCGRVPQESRRHFDVCVVGHLRKVKDPFRAAAASRLLPETS